MAVDIARVQDFFHDAGGPIECFSWGTFLVCGCEHGKSSNGKAGKGKDIRLIGAEVTKWKERKGHRLKKKMVTGIYGRGIETLIIGNGVEGALQVPDKVREDVASHGLQLVVARTPEACRLYNRLSRAGKRVALLAHGTC